MSIQLLVVSLLNQLPGILIGVVSTLVLLFGTGFIKEFFDERARIKKHLLSVAQDLLQICNQASTYNYKLFPRDRENVNSVLTNVEGIDNELGKVFNNFVNIWYLIANLSQTRMGKNETQDYREMLKKIDSQRSVLTTWANKFRNGKK
jgi:hypothetical protein